MPEDPTKKDLGPEGEGPENRLEQNETAHEYLARKTVELEDLASSIKSAGNPQFHQAIFAQMDRVIDRFREKGSRIINESGDEETAKDRIRAEFDVNRDEVLQHSDNLIGSVQESAPEVPPEPELASDDSVDDDAEGSSFEEQLSSVNVRVKEVPEDESAEDIILEAEDDPTAKEPDFSKAEEADYEELERVEGTDVDKEKPSMGSLESELGFLNISAAEVLSNLETEKVKELNSLMNDYRKVENDLEMIRIDLATEQTKKKTKAENIESFGKRIAELEAALQEKHQAIIAFYTRNINEILEANDRKDEANEELINRVAERINKVIQDTISFEATRSSIGGKFKGIAKQVLKTSPLMIGVSLAVGSMGLALPVTGLIAGGASWAIRRILAEKSKKSAPKLRLEQRAKVNEVKNTILADMFDEANLGSLREQLSAHISNALRQESSQEAGERLKAIGASENGELIPEAKIDDATKEFYLSALSQVEAKYPDLAPEKQRNMAIQLAMNLAQHSRNQSESARRLAEIKDKKPGLYKLIEKYNLLSNTGRIGEMPPGMTEEEKKLWQVSKYDLLSFGIGSTVGMAVRTSGIARTVLGALAGGGMGYALGEELARKKEAEGFTEIEKMITEAEGLIHDISFPAEHLDTIRRSRDLVQSRLETGILESNPLLKSRAENFIHLVRQTELGNESVFENLLKKLDENARILEAQVEYDLKRIEKSTKARRIVATVGGAIAGGALSFFGADISKKALEGLDEGMDKLGIKDDVDNILSKAGINRPEEQNPQEPLDQARHGGSDWKSDETDPWKTGRYPDEMPERPHAETNQTPVVAEKVPEPTAFSDKIDSSQVSGSDSIWKSTKAMFMSHAKDLGYQGDQAGLDKWAETQTANAVAHLNQEQGGNLTDLVHDGDMVHLEKASDGAWRLRLEESSGMKAGHLSDTNVDKFFANSKFEGNVQHESGIDPRTGDHYWELKSDDGTYKVYDWDRDGRPNVIMPDGNSAEMSVEDLKNLLQSKDLAYTQAELDTQALNERFDAYTESGQGQYESSMYDMAGGDAAKQGALLQHIVESKDPGQIESYLKDYLGHNGFSGNKSDIFLATLKDKGQVDSALIYDGDPSHGTQLLDKLRAQFDSTVRGDFDAVKHSNADEWHPIKIGDEYYLAQKYHTGVYPFRSDHYFISNGETDASGNFVVKATLEGDAMKQFFKTGTTKGAPFYPGEETLKPETPAPAKIPTPEVQPKAETPKPVPAPTLDDGPKVEKPVTPSGTDSTENPASPVKSEPAVTPAPETPVEPTEPTASAQPTTPDKSVVSEPSEPVFTDTEHGVSGIEASIRDNELVNYQNIDYIRQDGKVMFRLPGGNFREITDQNRAVLDEWNDYFKEHTQEIAAGKELPQQARDLMYRLMGRENPVTSVEPGPTVAPSPEIPVEASEPSADSQPPTAPAAGTPRSPQEPMDLFGEAEANSGQPVDSEAIPTRMSAQESRDWFDEKFKTYGRIGTEDGEIPAAPFQDNFLPEAIRQGATTIPGNIEQVISGVGLRIPEGITAIEEVKFSGDLYLPASIENISDGMTVDGDVNLLANADKEVVDKLLELKAKGNISGEIIQNGQVLSNNIETSPAASIDSESGVATASVEASPEDLDAALAVLSKAFKKDNLTIQDIESMDNSVDIVKYGSVINALIEKANGDPAQAHTLRGLQHLYDVVDAKAVEINDIDSALSVLSAGEKVEIKLTDIKIMDNVDALEKLKGRAEEMMSSISADADLKYQVSGFEKVIAAVDKRIAELKA